MPSVTKPATERPEAETVAYEVREGIAWLKFNRPEKRNCMSPKLNRQMLRVLDELEFRSDVGVLVLSGEGTAWSAGMDLKEYFRESEINGLAGTRSAQREAYGWWHRLRWYQKPTIAMVNGGALAAAMARCLDATWRLRPRRRSSVCRRSTGAFCPAAARPKSPLSCCRSDAPCITH